MSSGSYFPSPVLAVEISKKSGGTRRLGIPTIYDRIAQMVAKMYAEPVVEPMFHEDSCGYRPNKSAIDAIGQARKRCWKYDFVLELDIKGLFDNINHELLMRVVKRHVREPWIQLYVERWLKAPFELKDGTTIERTSGTPQGGLCEALHNPPYAKKNIMQSRRFKPFKYKILISFTLHNIRAYFNSDNQERSS